MALPLQANTAPPREYVSVYIIAKLIHAKTLVDIRKDWPKLHFTARWPLTAQLPTELGKQARLWTQDNEDDLIRADTVVGFTDPEEATPLGDPLWELGMAHAHRKPIYLAGPIERFGKYAHCKSVERRFVGGSALDNLGNALSEVSKRNDYVSHADRIEGRLAAIEEQIATMAALARSPVTVGAAGGSGR